MQEVPGDVREMVQRFSYGQEGIRVSGALATIARDFTISGPSRHVPKAQDGVHRCESITLCSLPSAYCFGITQVPYLPYDSANPEARPDPGIS